MRRRPGAAIFAAMSPMVRASALAALLLGLAACTIGVRRDAAPDVARFLAAAQAQDRVGFEAGIDRPTLREDLRRQMVTVARDNGLDVEGGPSDLALDRMITPRVFHLVDAAGQPLAQAPGADRVAPLIKVIDRDEVCLQAEGACLLTFARSRQGWRLTAMPAREITVTVGG